MRRPRSEGSNGGSPLLRVALYARSSTAEKSAELQLDALRNYAEIRGFGVIEEYVDEGVPGATAAWPALDRLLKDARRLRFDAVLVWKLDRLGRSLTHLVGVLDRLGSLEVDLISLGDPGLDTTGPSGRLIFHLLAAVAEFERDLIRERTRAGMAAARKRGKRIGRPRVSVPLSRARALLDQGKSVAATARELGVSRATLQRLLKRVPTKAPVTALNSVAQNGPFLMQRRDDHEERSREAGTRVGCGR